MKYLTVEQSLMNNSIRHKMRMERYLLLGMYRHALGSFRKSLKNYNNANQLKINNYEHLMNILADRVADGILRGS